MAEGEYATLRRPGVRPGVKAPFGAIRWQSHDFESEWTRLLQSRVRLLLTFVTAMASVLYLTNVAVALLSRGSAWDSLAEERPLLIGCLVGWVMTAVLWGRPMPRRGLEALDALVLYLLFAHALVDYHLGYRDGGERAVPYLALWIVLRAVVVPSRPLRTVLVSLPGPLAVLGVQWLHATWGDPVPSKHPDWASAPVLGSRWWSVVVWDQVYLAVAVAVAALSSSVSFSLRRKVHEARQLDRYEIEERIGAGAMGEVYRARHALMRRPVAIKFIRAEIAGERTIRRFEQEVRRTSRLTHPNTIAVYDYGQTEDGVYYYAMEMLEGSDLERLVRRTGPMPTRRAIHVLTQACGALQEAHAKGIIHRDVKPANLMLCEHGLERDVVKVMDFGLARDLGEPGASSTGEIQGNAETMSPEVLRGEEPGPAADLYGLAAVGCFLTTGRPIFDARTIAEFLTKHLQEEPVRPSARVPGFPRDLEDVLLRSLSKQPSKRHPSAAAFREDLLRCAGAGTWTQSEATAWWDRNGAALASDAPPGQDAVASDVSGGSPGVEAPSASSVVAGVPARPGPLREAR
jgi:serine/threonine-protein kinase